MMSTKNRDWLYHGAGVYALAAIAQSNTLLEGVYWGKPGEPHGPRTSRSFNAASKFITYNIHWGEGGVLVLDRAKLAQDYGIQPYVDTVCDERRREEQEEVIQTSAVLNLDQYLVSVVCDPRVIEVAKKDDCLEGAKSECGWAFKHEDDALAIQALDALLNHPKLNAWVPDRGCPYHGNWPDVMEVKTTNQESAKSPAMGDVVDQKIHHLGFGRCGGIQRKD